MSGLIKNGEGRVRAIWRILIQFLLYMILLMVVSAIQTRAQDLKSVWLFSLANGIYILGMLVMFWWLGRALDRRKLPNFGFHLTRTWWLDFLFGLFLGGFTLTAVALMQQGLGWAKFTFSPQMVFSGPFILAVPAALLFHLSVGMGEEMTFRGYQVRNLAEGLRGRLGSKVAVGASLLLTSVLFGAAHMLNPNASIVSGLNIILAGVVIGLGFVLTGELGMSIGFHVAWNFFQEFVFGYNNSGQTPMGSIYSNQIIGPALWTGGQFGPEAGLLILGVLALDVLLIIGWLRINRRWHGLAAHLADYQEP